MPALITETGKPAPDFILPGLDGNLHQMSSYLGTIVLLNFWSAECPWAERVDNDMHAWIPRFSSRIAWISIAVNVNEPEELVREIAGKRSLPMVLLDRTHLAVGLYGAKTTPHLYMVNPEGILVYSGGYDDVTFRQRNPTRNFIKEAVEALMENILPEVAQTPPFGCAIVRFNP